MAWFTFWNRNPARNTMSPPVNQKVIAALQAALPKLRIVTPDSPEYEESLKRALKNAQKPAGVITYPTTTQDVSALVNFSRDFSLDLAVCCGGHTVSGASSTDGGMCIDLSLMRFISVDTSTKHVTIQGGARWQDIYPALEEYGLAVPGGTYGSVGIGGLALMGGYGWLSGAHGLTIDNIVRAEIVLADGTAVWASEAENQDLFWAIRGAGPCFGVVTTFVIRGHEQGLVWGGELVFPRSALRPVIDFVNHLLQVSKGESSMAWMHARMPGTPEVSIGIMVFHRGTEEEATKFFAPLLDLKPIINTTRMRKFSETLVAVEESNAPYAKTTGGGFMFPVDHGFLEGLLEELNTYIEKNPDAAETVMGYEIVPARATLRRTQTDTSFPNRGAFGNVFLWAKYSKEESAASSAEWCRYMHDKIQKEFERRKDADQVDDVTKTAPGEYINYDGLGESPQRLYGVNYERLVDIKKRYDPHNVFNKCVDLFAQTK